MAQGRVTSANDLDRGLSFSVSDVSSAPCGRREAGTALCGCISSQNKVERGNGTLEYVCMKGEVG